MVPVLVTILGLGFTGRRLASRLLSRGIAVAAAVRDPAPFSDLADQGLRLVEWSLDRPGKLDIPDRWRLLHSIPTLPPPATAALHSVIRFLQPSRVVYISSTGVYGAQTEVDENTPPAPADARGEQRIGEETWLRAGPWSALILRAAAIYGPGRGVHTALREGRLPRGNNSAVVSRIHVDDLAAIAEAALFSELEGAWPVADDLPCASAEILDWCGQLPGTVPSVETTLEFAVAGRRVDGSRIRQLLGVNLVYPTWKTGVPACLAAER